MSLSFEAGVSRKSDQLRKVLLTLDKLLADTRDSKGLVSFGRKYPAHLDTIKSDLKQARQLLYGVVKKLNFPGGIRNVQWSPSASIRLITGIACSAISVNFSTKYFVILRSLSLHSRCNFWTS